VQTRNGGRNADAYKDCATLVGGYRRNYDEYCELFINYNKDGKITKVRTLSQKIGIKFIDRSDI
jgi:hypothetical protein